MRSTSSRRTRRLRARSKSIGAIAFVVFVTFSLPGLLLGDDAAILRDMSGWIALAALATSAASFAGALVAAWLLRRERRKVQDSASDRDRVRA
jgi:hypothetical protein